MHCFSAARKIFPTQLCVKIRYCCLVVSVSRATSVVYMVPFLHTQSLIDCLNFWIKSWHRSAISCRKRNARRLKNLEDSVKFLLSLDVDPRIYVKASAYRWPAWCFTRLVTVGICQSAVMETTIPRLLSWRSKFTFSHSIKALHCFCIYCIKFEVHLGAHKKEF